MRSTGKVFLLTAMVTVCLLLMHGLPTFSVNGMESRRVSMLSDLFPDADSPEEPLSGGEAVEEPVRPKPKLVKYHPQGVELIEDFAQADQTGLDGFYRKLLTAKTTGERIRIAYFGDSFIESDILTCDLREMLQEQYGGSGPGWVDAGGSMNANRPTVTSRYQNLKENVVIKKPFNNQLQTVSQRYYYATDGATLRLTGTNFRPHAASWTEAALYLATDADLTVEVNAARQGFVRETVKAAEGVQTLVSQGEMTEIAYRFPKIGRTTRLFGVTLDGDSGVSLDNFSMRGSAGFTLANIPTSVLEDIHRSRPYDLIILQFGLNVVDDKATDQMCRHYINRMKKVIANMQAAFPEAGIIVFSVPDRVQRGQGGFHTLRGITRLVAHQRMLASECGVAYLDVHRAMGGNESMVRFVEQGLAAKDYTHLNFKGGKVIAGHIFQSLLAGVENYRREQELKTEYDD